MTAEAVYAAEEAAFGGTELDDELASGCVDDLVAGLVTGPWWRSCGVREVELRTARAGATTSSARDPGVGPIVVCIARTASSTVSHELAHALAGVARGHDASFRAAHVDIVAALAGDSAATRLGWAYRDHGVAAGVRRWPAPFRFDGPGFVVV